MVKNLGGRPPSQIDLKEVEKLYGLGCTDEDVADFFGVTLRTILKRKKTKEFEKAAKLGRSKGRISVRRRLIVLAENGNAAAAIFLAKNLCGMRDAWGSDVSVHGAPALPEWREQALKRAAMNGQQANGDTPPSKPNSDSTETSVPDTRVIQVPSVPVSLKH